MARRNMLINVWKHSSAAFVNACLAQWSKWLSLAEYWYNTSTHLALGRSLFEVLYGFPPRHLGIPSTQSAPLELSCWLDDRELMLQLVRQHLLRAQTRMKRRLTSAIRSARSLWVILSSSSCTLCPIVSGSSC
jgi:hypothetical protein